FVPFYLPLASACLFMTFSATPPGWTYWTSRMKAMEATPYALPTIQAASRTPAPPPAPAPRRFRAPKHPARHGRSPKATANPHWKPSMNARVLPDQNEREHAHHPLHDEPWYLPLGDEVSIFEECHRHQLAVMLKGPTGCGKTRFVEHM